MSSARPLPTVIGPTENSLRALLARTLSHIRVPGYPAWIVLNAMTADRSAGAWRQRAAAALAAGQDEIDGVLAELRRAGLVADEETLTAAGVAELAAARTAVAQASRLLVEGITEPEQDAVRRVLDTIRRRAEELVAAHD
ncbi:hypothetical protein ROT00_00765 [Agromyces mediolanus]|uniref:hypothetical protein n=1 Tax=Agromyces mediolanus TaxID=41986 RepID=UPI0038324DFE